MWATEDLALSFLAAQIWAPSIFQAGFWTHRECHDVAHAGNQVMATLHLLIRHPPQVAQDFCKLVDLHTPASARMACLRGCTAAQPPSAWFYAPTAVGPQQVKPSVMGHRAGQGANRPHGIHRSPRRPNVFSFCPGVHKRCWSDPQAGDHLQCHLIQRLWQFPAARFPVFTRQPVPGAADPEKDCRVPVVHPCGTGVG